MSEAESATKAKPAAKNGKNKKTSGISPAAGVGVGVAIGSAAIVAALLYANRSRKNDRKA